MIIKNFNGFFNGLLPDRRSEKRAEKVMTDMLTFGKVVVNRFCSSHTEKIGAYRMFRNNSFSYEELAHGVISACAKNQGPRHLLCIQDTTECNFTNHFNRITTSDKDVGPVTNAKNAGIFCHPSLVVNAEDKIPVGIADIRIWNRNWDSLNKFERDYKTQDISNKESYRWIKAAINTKSVLSRTPVITIIGDRESDIYEELVIVPDDQTHLLIRSSINRIIEGENTKLFEKLEEQERKSSYDLKVKGNKKRKNRTAQIAIKWVKVKIKKPRKANMGNYPPSVEMWAIEAREVQETVPNGEAPIHWRLLTTHQIITVEDAIKCVEWYSNRWLIEELFRLIKSKGFELEAAQLETGAGLKKLLVMTLQVALTVMMLKLSLNKKENIKAEAVFNKHQVKFIELLLSKVDGKTTKQKNPHPFQTLSWAVWIIARLGGWSGYKSQGPPGYISIKNGLDIFYNKFEGYKIALEIMNKDVYKE